MGIGRPGREGDSGSKGGMRENLHRGVQKGTV